MYHSITIGEKNTWGDWHLIPTTRPLFNPPEVKTYVADIPGGDGVLDLTTALAGRPTYGNRKGSWTFIVQNGFRDWTALYSEIMAYLHGKTHRAILEDDPAYYYEGRFSVNAWQSGKDWSQIVIDYDVCPYKKTVVNEGTDWLWDPFNFETGVIRNYKNLSVLTTLTVTIQGDVLEAVPTIFCSAPGMKVGFEEKTYSLVKGVNVIGDVVLRSGENTLVFTGKGIVTIEYTGGRL